jgi:Tfp pilus assembly protein PilP
VGAIGLAVLLAIIVACGGDDGGGAPPTQGAKPAPKPAAAGAGSGKQLTPQRQVEGRVSCPLPQKGSRKCDPAAPRAVSIGKAKEKDLADPGLACDEGEYCLQTSDEGYLCGRCPERDQIRHVFKDRDFASEQNRDPFQSFVVKALGAGNGSDVALQKDPTSRCPRPDQLIATNYGFQDLKLVGIVAQGTQRKVLMLDSTAYGHIIKRGDCVGKEKAWVKDIGENFICFEVAADGRPVEARCVELHSKTIATSLPTDVAPLPSGRQGAPVVAPPPTSPSSRKDAPEQLPPAPPAAMPAPTNLRP